MDDSVILTLTLVLDQREPEIIDAIADAVSDPDDPRYGSHLDRAQFANLVDLSAEERNSIADWLAGFGMSVIDSPDTNRQLMFVTATFAQARAAFGQKLLHRGAHLE